MQPGTEPVIANTNHLVGLLLPCFNVSLTLPSILHTTATDPCRLQVTTSRPVVAPLSPTATVPLNFHHVAAAEYNVRSMTEIDCCEFIPSMADWITD